MRSKAASLLGATLRLASWPFRWLWRFIGRLGLAERRIFAAVWRFLGRLGNALRTILAWIGLLFWRPARWFLLLLGRPIYRLWHVVRKRLIALWRQLGVWGLALRKALTCLGLVFWRPIRRLAGYFWQAACWASPYLWEELGRLGMASRRLLAVITWPLVAPAKLLWDRVLGPPLTRAWDRVTLKVIVTGRAIRSRQQVRRARRQIRAREERALGYNQPKSARPSRRRWIRVVAALAAINLALLILLFRTVTTYKQPAGARLALPPTPLPSITTTPAQHPASTALPTPIPITPAPTPDHLAVGGSVAFVIRQNGNDDIYALSIEKDEPFRLTNHPADDRSPAWSPDGRWLAFSSRRDGNWELYLLEAASGELTRLTQHVAFEANPSWSPDSQWLAFESYHQENLDIYVMPVAGGDPIRLTTHPAADYAPAWAPAGRHIAFVSWRNGYPDIYLLALDDARDEAAVNISQSPDIEEDHPIWHPGGDYLAFTGKTQSQELVYIQPTLNNLPSGDPLAISQGREPAWAPNGNALVYTHADETKQYLLASSVNGWGAAPQVYLSEHQLSEPTWSASVLLPGILATGSPASTGQGTIAGPDLPLYLESVADPATEAAPYTLVTLDDLQVPGPFLNDRVDESFQALRQRVIEEAGWDFLGALDKMWEPIDALAPLGGPAKSWNKAGRAFDVIPDLNAGYHPVVEVVRESAGAKTWWRVYVRAKRQDGSQGEPLRTLPWNFQARYSGNVSDYEGGGRAKVSIPPGYYIDFTQLAADYGWERLPASNTWRTNFPATLFWHFEKQQGLDWESAMLELYTEQDIHPTPEGSEP